ncbi:MAG: hypothetical protein GY768_09640 [Planctomycetaceae bacterium]|nr:hypothetical protein [Planctomycetaceae bacterium]
MTCASVGRYCHDHGFVYRRLLVNSAIDTTGDSDPLVGSVVNTWTAEFNDPSMGVVISLVVVEDTIVWWVGTRELRLHRSD